MALSKRSILNLKRSRRLKKHSHNKTGAPPGTLHYVGEQYLEEMRFHITFYNQEELEHVEVNEPEEITPFLEKDGFVWLRVHGLHEVDQIKEIGQIFGLHPLVMEDILNTGQRPKTDDFDDYLFQVMRLLYFNPDDQETYSEQLSLIYSHNFLITFQESEFQYFKNIRERLKKPDSRIRNSGTDYLAYAIIDTTIDYYLRVMERFVDKTTELEYDVLEDPDEEALTQIHNLRRELVELRKSIWPARELLNDLIRQDHELINNDIKIYYEDVFDHTNLVIDSIQNSRDLLTGMFDTYMSNVSNRMNEVMKVLTIIATIFIPLTFIAGIYGMNFNTELSPYNMPELNTYYGYPITMGVMFVMAIIMLIYFRRKDWL